MGKLRVLARRGGAVALLAASLAACSPVYRDHGYAPTELDLAKVQVGDSREAVTEAIGNPVSTGLVTDDAWFYVGSRWRHYGALAPKPVTREVVAVSFTPSGHVANIERFGLERGRVVTLSRRVTETTIGSPGIVSLLLRNIGTIQADQLLSDDD